MSGASGSPIDERIVALVLGFRACVDDAARSDFVLTHPVMLHARVVRIAIEWPPIADSFLAAIRSAGALVHAEDAGGQMLIQTNPDRFPVGRGPIEALVAGRSQEHRPGGRDRAGARPRLRRPADLRLREGAE